MIAINADLNSHHMLASLLPNLSGNAPAQICLHCLHRSCTLSSSAFSRSTNSSIASVLRRFSRTEATVAASSGVRSPGAIAVVNAAIPVAGKWVRAQKHQGLRQTLQREQARNWRMGRKLGFRSDDQASKAYPEGISGAEPSWI